MKTRTAIRLTRPAVAPVMPFWSGGRGPLIAAMIVLSVAGCGDGSVGIGRAVLGLGEIPARVTSISIAVFDEQGLVVSTTVTPASSELDLGVPAEVPLLFQVVARTSTAAEFGFSGGLPAFVARTERTIPLTRSQVRVGVEARPAGGLRLDVRRSGTMSAGTLVIQSEVGTIPARYRLDPANLPGRVFAVLDRGRQAVTFEPDDDQAAFIAGGDAIWVAAETISVAEVELREAPRTRPLTVRAVDPDGIPIGEEGASGPVRLLIDGDPAPGLVVRLAVETTGTAALALPARVMGIPAAVDAVASGDGRFVVRATTDDGRGGLAVFNGDGPAGPPAQLVLTLARLDGFVAGTDLEVWTVDAAGRLTPPPTGTLSLAQSDPWVFRRDGDQVAVSDTFEDARISRRIVAPSRPAVQPAVVRARLLTATGTLSATLGLAWP